MLALLLAGALHAQPAPSESPTGDEDAYAAARAEFVAAYRGAAIRTTTPADDSPKLRAYPLYPYLRAARVEPELGRQEHAWRTGDDEAATLIREFASQPVAAALRAKWLPSLARRELWAQFLDAFATDAGSTALTCLSYTARIALDRTDGLAALVTERWLTPYQLPPECEAPFQWLRAQGELTEDLIAERARLLLDAGNVAFARSVARRLPTDRAEPLLARAALIEQPAREIDALLADPAAALDTPTVLEAWSRWARRDPAAARARYADMAARLGSSASRSAVALALALGLAWDRQPEALDYFAGVAPAMLDTRALEWLARAALWSGEWPRAAEAISALPERERGQTVWRYWSARIAESTGDAAAAEPLYRSVVGTDNYYAGMAAARLGEPVVPRVERLPLDSAAVESIAARDAFVRARELKLAGLRDLATREWRYGYETLPASLRAQAIHLAARYGMYDVAVATATGQNVFNDYELLYPRPYVQEVGAAAQLAGVEQAVLYGLLRQESLFRDDAVSAAGAVGIAQLVTTTARSTAARRGLPAPTRTDLFDPAVGISLGAAHLSDLLEEFGGQLPVALAAYNAGPDAAAHWLPDGSIDGDVWIENIPYDETRAYVRRVLWHTLVFAWLETGRPQSTSAWLAPVHGPNGP